ncbi:MAG: hypothetical protein ABEJ65_10930 [bacterium]
MGQVSPGENATADSPVVVEGVDTEAVKTQFQLGYSAFQRGELQNAYSRMRAAYNLDTSYIKNRYWLAKVNYILGNNDTAVRLWKNPGSDTDMADWFDRELLSHRLRYAKSPGGINFGDTLQFIGFIDGKKHDKNRNINPAAIEPRPHTGWFSASYRLGHVLRYSEEANVLKRYTGFDKPEDLAYDRDLGLLVAEIGADQISRITDTGTVKKFTEGIGNPRKIFTIGQRIYTYSGGRRTAFPFR